MDQVHVVRHKVLVEGRSQRAVARELGLARVTVRKYLELAAPARRPEAARRSRPGWEAVAERGRPCSPNRCGGRAANSG
jgi:transposase